MTAAIDSPKTPRTEDRPVVTKRVVTKTTVGEQKTSPPRTPKDPPTGDRPAQRPSRTLLIIAILGIVGTIGFGIAWAGERGDGGSTATAGSGSSADLLAAAKSFSTALTNFDGATIDRDFDAITAKSTGQFRSQADQFFSTDVRAELKKAQASSRGEIRSAFVQTSKEGRGTVFVVVDQTIANNQSPQPQADTLRMELGLILKGKVWKVERVSVLTAPSGGSTLGGGSTATTAPKSGN